MRKLLFIAIGFIITSCSNKDLDRDLAESKIIEHFSIPCAEVANFQNETLGRTSIPQKYADFINQGYIYCNSEGSWNNRYYLTREALPFYNQDKKIIVGNLIEFNEITGIKFNEAKNIATVNFILKRKDVSPFGIFEGRYEGEILEKSIQFELYDDGWRIVGNKFNNKFFSKEIFGYYNEEFMKDFDEETRQIKIESENQGD